MQSASARRVSDAEGIRRMVRKHDCALPAQYTKHSNARGHSLALTLTLMLTLMLTLTFTVTPRGMSWSSSMRS